MKSIYQPKYEKVITRLKKARIEAGFKQDYVAEKLNKYQSYLSKIEHGDRRIDVVELLELANFYGKDVSYFIEGIPKGKKGKPEEKKKKKK